MRSAIALSCTVSLLAAARIAEAGPQDAKLAEALFASGKEAMAHGDLAAACARFGESLKLDPAVGTRLNLATCEEKSGHLVAALDHFVVARSKLPKDDFRVPFADERVASLSRRVAKIVVKLATPPGQDAKVLRDGVEVPSAALAAPILVDPGGHAIVLERPGQAPERVVFSVVEGEEKVVELGAPPRAPAVAPPTPSPNALPREAPAVESDSGMSARRVLALGAAGGAVIGLATGTVTGILTLDAASTYRAHCTAGECDPEGLDAAARGRTLRVVSPVAFAVGALLGAASVYLFLSEPSSRKSAFTITPTATLAGGGLSFEAVLP